MGIASIFSLNFPASEIVPKPVVQPGFTPRLNHIHSSEPNPQSLPPHAVYTWWCSAGKDFGLGGFYRAWNEFEL